MADGSSRPIAEIDAGEFVLAADPYSGATKPEQVVNTFSQTGEKELTSLHLEDADRGISVTADHPSGFKAVAGSRLHISTLVRP